MTHWLLRYRFAPDYLERRATFRAEHLGIAWEAADAGTLILGGAAGDPPDEGLLVFTTREAAEAFAGADPYVAAGLVLDWTLKPWTTVVGALAATPVRP
ncbi:hypothetical protein COC42_01785 [Sphingomonas spermidinifaciens]|uniref:YCII-related domain-containing protein n=1 Tax=Sphingomonas spermidinifaciens TaxID=1141889 RepID=A0A2A4B540_9SPHN|nr:YciI-like protein [Sphingomonas spermidinifaciens]PCD03177.1 hypothetical protein COC42_01785 [Sphingomonas spermidinifaciens]